MFGMKITIFVETDRKDFFFEKSFTFVFEVEYKHIWWGTYLIGRLMSIFNIICVNFPLTIYYTNRPTKYRFSLI